MKLSVLARTTTSSSAEVPIYAQNFELSEQCWPKRYELHTQEPRAKMPNAEDKLADTEDEAEVNRC